MCVFQFFISLLKQDSKISGDRRFCRIRTPVDSQNRSYSSLSSAEGVLEKLSVELKEMLK
jgi:hypothetical protein